MITLYQHWRQTWGLVALRAAAAVACFWVAGLAAGPAAESTPDSRIEVRGMTVTCPGAGRIWGSDRMVETMATLKDLGVNWITIHPYAGIGEDGAVWRTGMRAMYRDPTWITRPIEEAHRLGLKIMIKPHIAYWGSSFSWRGAIEFDDDTKWNRFFDTYETWITHVAELSKDADAFVVGTELDLTVRHDQRWRRIIREVRSRTAAPLTYSAGWDRFEQIPFWDALDVVGIQAYFPLVAHERIPTREELDASWSGLVQRLDAYSRRIGRKIVLGELGYNDSSAAAARPWEYRQGGEGAAQVQRRSLESALSALERSERIVGAFLWKWFPGESRRGNFLKSTPAMRGVIRQRWGCGEGAAPRH